VNVRRAGLADAEAIAGVQSRTWFVAYEGIVAREVMEERARDRAQRWREHLRQGTPTWVAEDDGAVHGIMSAGPSRDADAPPATGELWMLYVAPEAQGRGTGQLLLEEALGVLRRAGFERATLWVFAANAAGRAFYEHMGWVHDAAAGVKDDPWAPEVRYQRNL
jgi:GNAT superfamily N-acetyltransferase